MGSFSNAFSNGGFQIGTNLSQIINLSIRVVADQSVLLNWSGIESATYIIERSTDGVLFSQIDTTAGLTYIDTGLTQLTLYFYRIKKGSIFSNVDIIVTDTPHTLIQDFDNISELDYQNGTPTLFEISNTRFNAGNSALKISTGGAGGIWVKVTPVTPVKFNGYAVIKYFIPTGSVCSGLALIASKSATFNASTATYTPLIAQYEGVQDQATFKTGWNTALIKRTDFISGTPALLDDPANDFTTFWITLNSNTGPIYIDSLHIMKSIKKSSVLITFDDGDNTVMEINDAVWGVGKCAFDYMSENGLKATSYIIGNSIGTAPALTITQANQLYDAGWDLGNHTYSHQQLTTLTDQQITDDIALCDTILHTNGWERGRKHIAYPGGSFTLDTNRILFENLGYKTGRTVQAILLNTPIAQTPKLNLFNIYSKGVGSTVTAANITDKIDESILSGRMFSFYIHSLGTPETSNIWDMAKFKTVLDYIITKRDAGLIDVLTISEYHNLVT